MISLGQTYTLGVVKIVDFGVYLDAENLGEVLLPCKHAPDEVVVGDRIDVFLYLDSEDRPIATTQIPKAKVREFACLKVVDTTIVGAFLDWGLDKDILVPFAEQHRPMEIGKSYLVYLYLDKLDNRVTASSKIDRFLDDKKNHHFKHLQPVNLIIANSTELGYKAIVNHSCWGVLYRNDVFERLSFGQQKQGFIKSIRPDGKIDLTLNGGKETRSKNAQVILTYLKNKQGFAPVHDKSEPKLISEIFGMSKAEFKKTIGGLYKQRLINIEKNGIRLIEQ